MIKGQNSMITVVAHPYSFRVILAWILVVLVLTFMASGCSKSVIHITNPIYPGAFADPSIVQDNDTFYFYATIDPWGAEELAVIITTDFIKFEKKSLNWPTKQTCTSLTSNGNNVWAPSVIKAPDNKFYMYVSAGSEIWAGVSEHPLGPWKNALPDSTPLIKGNTFPEYHMIDAECFIDTDGEAYLYWGSGLNWKNGHCFIAKLNTDMISFDGEIKDITPPDYFEAPYMLKRKNKYYLMYSEGKCTNSTYNIRYSVGDTPYGPWTEGINSPVLATSDDSTTLGPGHHTVFSANGQDYILYHRIYNNNNTLLRELCIDSLNFDINENIQKITPGGVEISIN